MKKIFCIIAVALVLPLAAAGCAAPAAPQEAQPLQQIRIGVMSDVGAVPFIIADQQGLFAEKGLDVTIRVFKSAVDRDTALQTGNLDGAMTDMLSIILFQEAGFDVKMTSDTYGNYKLITAPGLNEDAFNKVDQIAIGLSSNTVIDFATQKIAEANDFQNKLVKTAIPQMPVRLEMLKAGKINGATLPEPLASASVLDGGTLVSSTEEFDLYPAIFVMTETSITENAAGIKLMYEAYNEAVDYVNSQKTDDIFDLLVERLGFPPVLKGKFQLPVFAKIGAPDEATFTVTSEWMKELGLSKQSYLYDDLTDTSVLPD